MGPKEARALLAERRPPCSKDDVFLIRELLKCWAAVEPESAAAWLKHWAHEDDAMPREWAGEVLKPLAAKSLQTALMLDLQLSQTVGSGCQNIELILDAAAQADPQATLAFVELHGHPYDYQASRAFGGWLQNDPAAACAWICKSKLRHSQLLKSAVTDVALNAPEQLAALLASLPAESDAHETAVRAMNDLQADRDPAGAVNTFSKLNAEDRAGMIQSLALHMATKAEPAEFRLLFEKLNKEERANLLKEMAENLYDDNPDRVLSMIQAPGMTAEEKVVLLSNNPPGPEHAEMFLSLASYMAGDQILRFWNQNLGRHFAETMPVLKSMLTEGKVDKNLLVNFVSNLSEQSSSLANQLVAELSPEYRDGPAATLQLRSALADPNGDLSAYTAISNAATRKAVMTNFTTQDQSNPVSGDIAGLIRRLPQELQIEAAGVIYMSPNEAVALAPVVEKALASSGTMSKQLEAAVSQISHQMPLDGTTMEWLGSLPSSPELEKIRQDQFSNFSGKDVMNASVWLRSLPNESPERDALVTTLVKNIRNTDADSALQWAATIQNDQIRTQIIQSINNRTP